MELYHLYYTIHAYEAKERTFDPSLFRTISIASRVSTTSHRGIERDGYVFMSLECQIYIDTIVDAYRAGPTIYILAYT